LICYVILVEKGEKGARMQQANKRKCSTVLMEKKRIKCLRGQKREKKAPKNTMKSLRALLGKKKRGGVSDQRNDWCGIARKRNG